MEVKNVTKYTTFGDLHIGDCFIVYMQSSRRVLFMKVESFTCYDNVWNAIRLKDGCFWPFKDYVEVKKVNAKITYEEV